MVSRVPTYSGKSIRVPQPYVLPLLLFVGLLAGLLVGSPWMTITALALAYVGSIPFSLREYRALERRAASLAPDDSELS
jgi:CDP-diacylglycerol--serine O-phosphatidyltransferase